VIHATFGRTDPVGGESHARSQKALNKIQAVVTSGLNSDCLAVELARCFLRLANLSNFALDRLSRYEASLWRQADQIAHALEMLDRRKPQERRAHFWFRREKAIERQ
jgi:hypothetical protein